MDKERNKVISEIDYYLKKYKLKLYDNLTWISTKDLEKISAYLKSIEVKEDELEIKRKLDMLFFRISTKNWLSNFLVFIDTKEKFLKLMSLNTRNFWLFLDINLFEKLKFIDWLYFDDFINIFNKLDRYSYYDYFKSCLFLFKDFNEIQKNIILNLIKYKPNDLFIYFEILYYDRKFNLNIKYNFEYINIEKQKKILKTLYKKWLNINLEKSLREIVNTYLKWTKYDIKYKFFLIYWEYIKNIYNRKMLNYYFRKFFDKYNIKLDKKNFYNDKVLINWLDIYYKLDSNINKEALAILIINHIYWLEISNLKENKNWLNQNLTNKQINIWLSDNKKEYIINNKKYYIFKAPNNLYNFLKFIKVNDSCFRYKSHLNSNTLLAVWYMSDINKWVCYITNDNWEYIWRFLVWIDINKKLVIFPVYYYKDWIDMEDIVKVYWKYLADKLKIDISDDNKPNIENIYVSNIHFDNPLTFKSYIDLLLLDIRKIFF